MRIDLTCPVEAWKSTLPTKENPACEVTLFNLSSLQVVSVEVTLLLSSADGEETAKIIHRSRGMNGAPGKTFLMTVPVEGHISPEKYEVTVEKVWFDNASVWRREKENTITYTPNNLHRSAQLTTLRSIAGEMASGYPQQQKGLWVCVCGRPNPDDAVLCARCHQEKSYVFTHFSREAVDAVIAQREAALTEHGRETLQNTGRKFSDEKDFVRRKGKYAWVWKLAVCLVLLAGLVFGAVKFGVPYMQYELAQKAYEAGDYADAAEQFAALGDYKDAAHMARYSALCQENALVPDAELLTDEEYAARLSALEALGNYEAEIDGRNVTTAALRDEADWKHAEYLFQNARYDEAVAIYNVLGDLYDAPERLTEIEYIRACEMLDNGHPRPGGCGDAGEEDPL